MAKILLTGAAGFIGYWFAKTVAARGVEIVGIDNLNSYYSPLLKLQRLSALGFPPPQAVDSGYSLPGSEEARSVRTRRWMEVQSKTLPGLRFIQMDITDNEALNALMERERFTHVVHLAAQAGVRYSIENPQAYEQSNLRGFLNILEGCRHFRPDHLVYASSSSVYGANNKVPFAEADRVDHPMSLYAATKRSNELMASAYSELYGLRVTGLRFFTVYGPWGRPDMAPMKFANSILNGVPINVFNHGRMSRDFTYVADIAEGMERVVFDRYSPEYARHAHAAPLHNIYNLGRGNPTDLSEFIATLEELLHRKAVKHYVGMQPGDVPTTYADTSLLMRRYDYRPSTDLRTGLNAFTEWLFAHKALIDTI